MSKSHKKLLLLFLVQQMFNIFTECMSASRGCFFQNATWGHGGRVVTLSPPTSEAGVQFPARPQVGKLVVACRWLAVYSTEP